MEAERALPCLSPSTSPLAKLPVVDMEHLSPWTSYLRRVYPGRRGTVDLNTFTFFYWDAPLSLERINFCDWADDRPFLREGTPWIGGRRAWEWGPEHFLSQLGFFVMRSPSRNDTMREVSTGQIEVLRFGPNRFTQEAERGRAAWFYHAVGSGVYLDCSHLASPKILFRRMYRGRTISAPREELVFETNSTRFWSTGLRFHSYARGVCSFTPRRESLLQCAERRAPRASRAMPALCGLKNDTMV